jgi:hypothetical protein
MHGAGQKHSIVTSAGMSGFDVAVSFAAGSLAHASGFEEAIVRPSCGPLYV